MKTKIDRPGKYFTWDELNAPNDVTIRKNLRSLVQNVLDPLREILGQPVYITSAYRDREKNESVGGVPNSLHMSGQAVDLYSKGISPDYIFNVIKTMLPYDQLILYRPGARGKFPFIHVSYLEGKNRNQTFITERKP
jgi:hypothetical protein